MFENIKKLIKGTARESEETTMIMPYLGSALRSSKKEAMAYLLFETMRWKNKKVGDKIFVTELMEVLRELEKDKNLPTVYKIFPNPCWNAFWEMGNEGLLIIHKKEAGEKEEDFVVITEKLNELLSKI